MENKIFLYTYMCVGACVRTPARERANERAIVRACVIPVSFLHDVHYG